MTRAGDIRKIHGSRQALATRAGRGNRRGSGLKPSSEHRSECGAAKRSASTGWHRAQEGHPRKSRMVPARRKPRRSANGPWPDPAGRDLRRNDAQRNDEQTLARRPRSAFRRLRHPSSPLPKPVRFSESTCSTSAAAAARDWPLPNRSWHRTCFADLFRIAERFSANHVRNRSQKPAKAPSYRAPKRLQSASFAPVSTESSRGASAGAAMPDRAALRSSARASRWSATSGFFARSGPCR